MHDTLRFLQPSVFPPINRDALRTLQINIGLRCNQACLHCHVNSNPYRKERMSKDTIAAVLGFLQQGKVGTLDITGGAPEMHPQFRELVEKSRALGVRVIDRCNLTIMEEEGFNDLAEFLAENRVEVVASLPCYTKDNVDEQRGKGTFESSIRGLQRLNKLGYGTEQSNLVLNLVYNPLGATLPGPQKELLTEYRRILEDEYGIFFTDLFAICNMPVNRFGSTLISKGQFHEYIHLLKSAYNEKNLQEVMCRSLISVDWEGYLYDCDFNQMLGLAMQNNKGKMHISDLHAGELRNKPIQVRDHCYACTAGQGSSCGGALI